MRLGDGDRETLLIACVDSAGIGAAAIVNAHIDVNDAVSVGGGSECERARGTNGGSCQEKWIQRIVVRGNQEVHCLRRFLLRAGGDMVGPAVHDDLTILVGPRLV